MHLDRALLSRCAVAAATACLIATGCSSSSSGGAAPALTAPAVHSETFHGVTPRANHLIQRTLPLMRGVASNTYQGTDLVVTYRSTAVKLDQTNVENTVRQAKQKAATKKSSGKSGKT